MHHLMQQDPTIKVCAKSSEEIVLKEKNDPAQIIIEIPLDGSAAENLPAHSGKKRRKKRPPRRPKEVKKPSLPIDTNRILAEINFDEGNEALQRGDRFNALRYYHHAHGYDPTNVDVYLTLANLLAQNIGTLSKAKQLLVKGMRLVPDNNKLRDKFEELCKPLIIARRLQYRRRSAGLEIMSDRPERIKNVNLLVLAAIFITTIALVFSNFSQARVHIIPVEKDQLVSLAKPIEFHWQSSDDQADYLFQIQSLGDVLLEHYTQENSYVLSQTDVSFLKPGRWYHWRALPLGRDHQPLPCHIIEGEFHTLDK